MNLENIRSMAESRGVHPGRLSKTALVKTLQVKEGNFDCFATASSGECDQSGCSWREDCFEAARKGELS